MSDLFFTALPSISRYVPFVMAFIGADLKRLLYFENAF